MKTIPPNLAAMLHLFADGKQLEKQPPSGDAFTDVDSPEQILWADWVIRIKPDPLEKLADFVRLSATPADFAAAPWKALDFTAAARALVEKCPALLEVEL